MKDLIIFGVGKVAEVIFYYAKFECNRNVIAFTVDQEFRNVYAYNGLPVIVFEEIENTYPPDQFDLFIAIGYSNLNRDRQRIFELAKQKGYNLTSIICNQEDIPKNVSFGKNCFIMSPAIIHPYVEIGDNTFVWSGAMIGHHSKIGNHCWITSSANIAGEVTVGNNCFLAMNATITQNLKIGNECLLGANTLVTKNLNNKSVVIEDSSKLFRLNSDQFLRFGSFSNL